MGGVSSSNFSRAALGAVWTQPMLNTFIGVLPLSMVTADYFCPDYGFLADFFTMYG